MDFLGFSRQKRDLSMGYTGFSVENFSRALLPFSTTRRTGARSRGHAEARDSPSGKLKLFFDFPEDIFAAPFPLATRFDARRNGSALMQSKDVRCKCKPTILACCICDCLQSTSAVGMLRLRMTPAHEVVEPPINLRAGSRLTATRATSPRCSPPAAAPAPVASRPS